MKALGLSAGDLVIRFTSAFVDRHRRTDMHDDLYQDRYARGCDGTRRRRITTMTTAETREMRQGFGDAFAAAFERAHSSPHMQVSCGPRGTMRGTRMSAECALAGRPMGAQHGLDPPTSGLSQRPAHSRARDPEVEGTRPASAACVHTCVHTSQL